MDTRTSIQEYYESERDNLVRMVNRRTHNMADAEDVVQSAFLNALTFEANYRPELASLKTWFHHILNRTYARMRSAEFDSVELEDTDIMDFSFDDRLEDKEDVATVKKYISGVEDNTHKNILYLSIIMGEKGKDVSTQLGIRETTVRVALCRHKEIIRGILLSSST